MGQILYTDPGSFIHTIDILDKLPGRNFDGSFTDGVTIATGLPAAVEQLSYTGGSETVKPGQVVPQVTHRVIIWYLPELKSRYVVRFYPKGIVSSGRTFMIMRIVDPDEQQVQLHLICSERNDGR